MAASPPPPDKSPAQLAREERLAEQLRANLKRRKQQARARKDADADGPEGAAKASPGDDSIR